MLRGLEKADGPQFFELMEHGFAEESAMLGNRPEEFQKIFRRIFRWDSRLLLALLDLVGRPIVRALVVEAEGRVVATTLVTFPPVSAYVSNVVVDATHRRRGYARLMLEEAHRAAKQAHRKYIALDVLETNTPARTLYEAIGYRPLRAKSRLVHESMADFATVRGPPPGLRPFQRSDVRALVALVRRQTPPEVESVLPTRKGRFVEPPLVTRMLDSENAAWVIDRGRGPEAYISASVSAAMEAAFMNAPILAESVDDGVAKALVATAGAWCAQRHVPRILTMVANDDPRARATLEATGFHNVVALWTLYRPVD